MKNKSITARLAAFICASAAFAVNSYIPSVSADTSIMMISSADELANFLKNCTSDAYSKGRTFIIENDIDMSGKELSSGCIFCGTLMGNGHTISNVKMNFREANGGFFTNIETDGQVRDLYISGELHQYTNTSDGISTENIVGDVMKNAGISGISPTQSTGITGGIAAVNSGLIVNCSFDGTISGQKTTGAIVGLNSSSGTVDSCASSANVSGYERTGGIAGENSGVIKNSQNIGKVNPAAEETTRDTGGIAGYSSGVVEYCTNEGSIGCIGYGTNTGGITGKQNGCIIECRNKGKVGAKKNAGGITGIFVPYTEIDMITDDLRNEFDKQKQDLKDETQKLRDNLKKSADDLADGLKLFNGSIPLLGGSSESMDRVLNSLSNYIDSASERRANSSDAITETLDNIGDLSLALRDAIEERKNDTVLRDELSTSIERISTSIEDVNTSMSGALDSVSGISDDISTLSRSLDNLMDNMSVSLSRGSQDMSDITDSLTSALDRTDINTDALDKAAQSLLNLSNTLDDVVDDLSDTADDVNDVILEPFIKLRREVNKVIKDIEQGRTTAKELKQKLIDLRDKINEQLNQWGSQLPTPKPAAAQSSEPKHQARLLDFFFPTVYAEEDESRLLSLDEILDTERIKEEMKKVISVDVTLDRRIAGEYSDTAVIRDCINSGSISCSENSGGITGNMGVETLRRKGDTIQLPDGKTVLSDMMVKAVINSCINDGSVYAKERYAGGIAGASNVGIIKNCLGAGEISAENIGYAGGIGGDINSSVLFSIGAARISGKNDLGGITGSGSTIRECLSLASFDSDAKRIGMIAGSADGNVENNCFISEGIGGIGGASYKKDAEDIPFESMKCTDKLPERMDMFFNDDWVSEQNCFPQIKALAQSEAQILGLDIKALSAKYAQTVFTVNFIIDGKTEKSLVKNYGETLSNDEIPLLTGANGRYPHWNRDTSEPIRRHTDFNVEYSDATMTIASGEEPPLLLVEGNFSSNTTVTVMQGEVTADFLGYTKGNAYTFRINPKKDGENGFKLHILSRDKNSCAIGIVRNGKPEVINCERDGSYLVCDLDSPQTFVILSKNSGSMVITIIICTTAAAVAAVLFVILKRRKKKLEAENVV